MSSRAYCFSIFVHFYYLQLDSHWKWDFIIYVTESERSWAEGKRRGGLQESRSHLQSQLWKRVSLHLFLPGCLFVALAHSPIPSTNCTQASMCSAYTNDFLTYILEAIFIFVNLLLNLVCVVGFIFLSLWAPSLHHPLRSAVIQVDFDLKSKHSISLIERKSLAITVPLTRTSNRCVFL